MDKLLFLCALLVAPSLITPLSAQGNKTNLLMGIGNDVTYGSFNTTYGFLDNLPGIPNRPDYPYGYGNTFMGANSGNSTRGSENTAVGLNAGGWFINGSKNVFIGTNAASYWASSDVSSTNPGRTLTGNSFLGYQAGNFNRADYNVFIGYESGYTNVTGIHNVFVGSGTGYANTGGDNAFLGYQAGQNNSTGTDNTFVGSLAGQSTTTGQFNSFVGSYSGQANTTGRLNTFLGYGTGSNNTTGGVNTFLGSSAGSANTTGIQNTYVGNRAGESSTSGNSNTVVGYQAGSNLTTGNNNIIVGPRSATALTAGSDNVLVGNNTQVAGSNLQNVVAIGSNARVALNNAIVLGDPTNTSIAVGIGTDSPQFPLDVRGTIHLRNNGKIKFAHLSNSIRQGATDQFLTVNEQGETVLAKHRLTIDNVNQWSDKVFSDSYTLRPLTGVASYIREYGHLPGVPSAEEVVKEGVDLVKMNATLLEKVEELTLYSIEQEKANQKLKVEMAEMKALMKQLLEKK
ncbi:hypothetical protein [Spirosoma flavus]